jgi:glycosyltransferase involved in cell wall biosynthesis
MKILILNDYFGPTAGGFVVAYNLAMECRRRGHEITFLTTVQSKKEQGKSYHEGIPVYKLYTRYPFRFRGVFIIWNPFVFKEFARIVQEIRPDVIHTHIIHMYLSHYVLKLAYDLHVPIVLTAHDTMTFCYTRLREECSPNGTALHKAKFSECLQCQRFRYVPFRNYCLRHYINTYVSQVVSVSDALKAGLELNGIQHVRTIYNGIDPHVYDEIPREHITAFRQKYALQGKNILLFAGRSSPPKGLEYLVRALPQVLKSCPDTRVLILCKHNDYIDSVCKIAKELGVYEALVLPGWLKSDELTRAYVASDICVVPSIQFESLTTVCLEAMAAKKPVIGTSVGGIPEMIVHGKTGYLVPPRQSSELAQKIEYLLQHKEIALQLGKAGYQRILETFYLRNQVDKILEVYNEASTKS